LSKTAAILVFPGAATSVISPTLNVEIGPDRGLISDSQGSKGGHVANNSLPLN
jgi:hypothetical protein